MLLPAPFGPMIEVSAPRRNSGRDVLEGDELAEPAPERARRQDDVALGRHRRELQWSSEPQMPRGKNSTQAMNTSPTTSCQWTV